MRGKVAVLLVALVAAAALDVATVAHAADTVTIFASGGYPLPNLSSESTRLVIERNAPYTRARELAIDEFFAAVKKVLSENGVTTDWTLAVPDAPFVRIEIDVDGRRITLVSAHPLVERERDVVLSERGIEALDGRDRDAVVSRQSDTYRRHRRAIDQILLLARQRMNAQLAQ